MNDSSTDLRRRDVLGMLGATTAAAVAPPTIAKTSSGAANQSKLSDKFFADGQVRPFAGNTIVCHLPQQGEDAACFDALLDIYREARAWAFGDDLTMLPPSSYHMTVFGGANDRPRSRANWPGDLPLNLPMKECNRIVGERLRSFRMGVEMPVRMKADPDRVSDDPKTLAIRLVPLDAGEAAKLKFIRVRLAETLNIKPANLESYEFHITLAYLLSPVSSAHQTAIRRMKSDWHRAILAHAPVIKLGPPEYCTFVDMFAFARQFYLS